MARSLLYFVLSATFANAAVISDRKLNTVDVRHPAGSSSLHERDGPFRQDFNLTTGKLGREVLVQNDTGLTITCIDCQLEGQFTLELNVGVDENVLNELMSALIPQAQALKTSAESVATSIAGDITNVVSQAVPVATSVLSEATAAVSSFVASAATPLSSVLSEATAGAESLASDAMNPIKSIIPGIGNLLNSRNAHIAPRQVDDLISEILAGFDLSLGQTVPIHAKAALEIVTGDQAIEVNLPTIAPAGLAVIPPTTIDVGVFQLAIALSPLALTTKISMQPHMNVTVPFEADLAFQQALRIGGQGVQDADVNLTVEHGNPVLIGSDLTLCISAALGPLMRFALSIPSSNVGVELEAQLEVPRISLCADEDTKVDEKCQPGGPIVKALHLNSTASFGLASKVSYRVPEGIGLVLPKPSQLPQISEDFPLIDTCVDIGGTTQR